MNVQFEFFRLRFHFQAAEPIYFPPGQSGNVVRGAFGTILRKTACTPACTSAAHQPGCAYARIFEPKAARLKGPSGLTDRPRPFTFRTAHLDGCQFQRNGRFHFDAHLFDTQCPAVSHFVSALSRLATEGLGPKRGRAALASVEQLALDDVVLRQVFDGGKVSAMEPTAADLTTGSAPVNRVRVCFLTPTELKAGEGLAEQPEFPILFARIRDRLSTLRSLYGPGPLAIDFRGMGERAKRIKMTRCELHAEKSQRRSSRTGQAHALGGFTGEAEYEGDLAEFLPYLHAARWTGVGRQTVWGKGEIRISE